MITTPIHRLVLTVLVLLPLLSLACKKKSSVAVLNAPTTNPAHAALTPTDIPGVKNFAQVSPVLYRGAQPTEAGFAELKKRGVKTIVSLRSFNGDSDEIEDTGLQYIRFDCKAWHIEQEDMVKFLKVVEDPANQPVFVHCLHGSDRTGSAVAVYRMMEQGWTSDEALSEINNFGYHPIFENIPDFLKNFDPEKTRKQVDAAPKPKLRVP